MDYVEQEKPKYHPKDLQMEYSDRVRLELWTYIRYVYKQPGRSIAEHL